MTSRTPVTEICASAGTIGCMHVAHARAVVHVHIKCCLDDQRSDCGMPAGLQEDGEFAVHRGPVTLLALPS